VLLVVALHSGNEEQERRLGDVDAGDHQADDERQDAAKEEC
jgi:hypothetical protein